MWKIYSLLLLSILLSSCGERYRYPCQDPENMRKPECSQEMCVITRECPKNIGANPDGK